MWISAHWGILLYMKNTSDLPKLRKQFDRLSAQYTRCRDLDKMAQMLDKMYRLSDEIARLEIVTLTGAR